jgi:hypothetical protein
VARGMGDGVGRVARAQRALLSSEAWAGVGWRCSGKGPPGRAPDERKQVELKLLCGISEKWS